MHHLRGAFIRNLVRPSLRQVGAYRLAIVIQTAQLHSSGRMSSPIFEAIISATPATGSSVPANASDLAHHNKNGKGFINPWSSWRDQNGPAILFEMIMYVTWRSAMQEVLTKCQAQVQGRVQQP